MSNLPASRIIVTVIGGDRIGIIAAVTATLAECGANVLDISQTIMQEFFVMIMLVDIDRAVLPFDEIKRRLQAQGETMGLRVEAQREDVFHYMHRI